MLDLFHKYSSVPVYCMHSDWILGYIVKYYLYDERSQEPESTLLGMETYPSCGNMRSETTERPCEDSFTSCHNMKPEDMESLALSSYLRAPDSFSALPHLTDTTMTAVTSMISEKKVAQEVRSRMLLPNVQLIGAQKAGMTSVSTYDSSYTRPTLYSSDVHFGANNGLTCSISRLHNGCLPTESAILRSQPEKRSTSARKRTSLMRTQGTSKDLHFTLTSSNIVRPREIASLSWMRRQTPCFIRRECTIPTTKSEASKHSQRSSLLPSSAIQSLARCRCTTIKEWNISRAARSVAAIEMPGTVTLPFPAPMRPCRLSSIPSMCWQVNCPTNFGSAMESTSII